MRSDPILRGDDHPVFPHDNKCPFCQQPVKQPGNALISAGALLLDKTGDNSRHVSELRAYFYFLRQSSADDNGAEVMLVDDLIGGQFDIGFCSVGCLRSWINGIIDRLEYNDDNIQT